jgi:site-specific DNA recombinase
MSTGVRTAIYARISEDSTGEGAGVERQIDDARALAVLRGWDIVAEFSDNDISALTGKHRPGYEALRQAAASGDLDRIIVWQTSRLWRHRGERARDIDMLAARRVGVIAVKGPDLDLSTAYGRGMAGLLGEFDTMESEVKGERVAAANIQRAKNGKPSGGLGYGWTKVGPGEWIEDAEQAAVVRDITDRLLSGHTLIAVTKHLNEVGTPPPGMALHFKRKARAENNPNGHLWNKTSVKKLAIRPANAAVRVHHRGRPTEVSFEGQWPALIPRDRWEALCALLSARTTSISRPGGRKHLLSWGIGACGVCGAYLRVTPKGAEGKRKLLYVCDQRACVGRNEANVDELVSAVVVERLSRPDALDWLAGDGKRAAEAADRAQALRGRLDGAADKYAEGTLTMAQLERVTLKLKPQIKDAEAERVACVSVESELLTQVAGPRAAETWERLEVAQKRALLEAMGLHVLIDKTKQGPVFRPESVRIEWRQA